MMREWKESDFNLQVKVIKRYEGRFSGRIQRDIVPVFVNEQQERTQRVYHRATFKIEYSIQKGQSVHVIGVLRLRVESKASHPVRTPFVVMLLFAGYFQHGVTHSTARIERIRFFVRCFRRQYLFYSIGKSSGCCSVRNHITRQTLPVQSIRYVETFNVVHRVFQNE